MERTHYNGERLRALVKTETGKDISSTMMSFILRGSRRCSIGNALALHAVTGVPIKTLTEWSRVSNEVQLSGRRPKRVA